jgi:1-phosphofructokinase
MIYTVTINPSLDYIVNVNNFKTGVVNRTTSESINAGGKGINVSIVLHNLGIESVALGFTAGFTGEKIRDMLSALKISSDFIAVKNGISRINVKLKSEEETEINGQGPEIAGSDLQKLFDKITILGNDDILVLAGSIPQTLPETLYMDIMKKMQAKKTKIVVDATNNLLKNVLLYHPFLVKPNNHELGEIFDIRLETKKDVILYAEKIQKLGARNVLVSMAKDGAVLIDETGKIYESTAPKGKPKNSVGAGDSMVAGFLAGFLNSGSYAEAFKMGLCTGSASAFSEQLATRSQVEKLLQKQHFDF